MGWLRRKKELSHIVVEPESDLAKQIAKELTGRTPEATFIAELIEKGWVVVHYMNRPAFLKERKRQYGSCWNRFGVVAWALGNEIFVQEGKNVYEQIVHEGEHALRWIYRRSTWHVKYGPFSVGKFVEEIDVRRSERRFRQATGKRCFFRWLTDSFDVLGYL